MLTIESVPYMNNVFGKALYKRNMARNKLRQYGKKYWEENRTHHNKVVPIRKKLIATYFYNKSSQWLPNTPFASTSECLVS